MKTLPLLALVLLFAGCTSVPAPHRQQEQLDTLNYPVGEALRGLRTTTGVVLQASPVRVKTMTDNLIVGLPTAIVDGFTGTDWSTVELAAMEYVIRLDGTRYTREQLLTVVQGPESKIAVGEPVFIIASPRDQRRCSVRLVSAKEPQNYFHTGLREQFEQADQMKSRVYNAE